MGIELQKEILQREERKAKKTNDYEEVERDKEGNTSGSYISEN